MQDATTNNSTRWLELIRAHHSGGAESMGAAMVRLARLAAAEHRAQAGAPHESHESDDAMCVRANGLARRPTVQPLSRAMGLSLSGSVVMEDDR